MDQQSVRKTFKYKLQPTAEQEGTLGFILRRCRELYNAGLEERREADGWYVTFSCADVPIRPLPLTGQETGIDLGLESFATLAEGSQIANPRLFRVAEMNLKRAQRRMSRRVKGSKRRRKAVTLLAKAHARVRRARADFHHKTALALVRQYDTIYHEDLQPANMVKNHQLAKSISDAGGSGFL